MRRKLFNPNTGLTQTITENPEDLMYIYVLIHPLTKSKKEIKLDLLETI